jgi:hypothetical protein
MLIKIEKVTEAINVLMELNINIINLVSEMKNLQTDIKTLNNIVKRKTPYDNR